MISIIIPSYNEPNVSLFGREIEVEYPEAQIIISHDPQGKGKGWAIREGLKKATGDIIVYIDGDGDIKPQEIGKLLSYINEYDIVVATKYYRDMPFRRKIFSFGFRLITRILFDIKVDTQTGLKVFHRYALPKFKNDGFVFDVEILWEAKRQGFQMIQIPIECKVSKYKGVKVAWKMLKEVLCLRLSSRVNG